MDSCLFSSIQKNPAFQNKWALFDLWPEEENLTKEDISWEHLVQYILILFMLLSLFVVTNP